MIEHIASLIPEPSPQDDADVVDEMRTAYATAVHEQPPEDGWSAARAVARRGMVTLDEVEKAIVGVWVEGGHNNLPDFVAATRAGLTAKSTKQERVTVVGLGNKGLRAGPYKELPMEPIGPQH
jgi:hypothetical protein